MNARRFAKTTRAPPKSRRRSGATPASPASMPGRANSPSAGYLHNHARMWFASIWIFTLRLPWVLGADFFMRHLCDGDPASNTLSWRWVAGLHTRGKTYLARASNIATYTGGRFTPQDHDLAAFAPPLTEAAVITRTVLALPAQIPPPAPASSYS